MSCQINVRPEHLTLSWTAVVGKTVPYGSIQINGGALLYIPLARYDVNDLQVADVFSIEGNQTLK
jgi:hypothetical protein